MVNVGDRFIWVGGDGGLWLNNHEYEVIAIHNNGREIQITTQDGRGWWVVAPRDGLVTNWRPVPRVPAEAAPERFIIWNATNNSVYSPQGGNPRHDVTREQGLRIMNEALAINGNRVLHLIPLRSVAKMDANGLEEY